MKRDIANIVTLVILTLVISLSAAISHAADETSYGDVNISAINSGNLQFKGVTWCKKHFDKCIITETFSGGNLKERELATTDQFVVMQTGITNPVIISSDVVSGGRYRILFVYDQLQEHLPWIPEYEVK